MKQTIRVFTDVFGDSRAAPTRVIEADVDGGLAVYKDIIYRHGWALVHVASKNPLCYPLRTKALAIKVRAKLLAMGDWTAEQKVLDAPGGVIREHYEEIRAVLQEVKEAA